MLHAAEKMLVGGALRWLETSLSQDSQVLAVVLVEEVVSASELQLVRTLGPESPQESIYAMSKFEAVLTRHRIARSVLRRSNQPR